MSFNSMLKHRCQLMRLNQEAGPGSPVFGYQPVLGTDGQPLVVKCFLDLNFIRQGKDPQWTPEAGRPMDRTGVWFGPSTTPVKSGDRIKMTKGPVGTFEIQSALDEAWTPSDLHHLEIGVKEVAAQRTRAAQSAQGGVHGSP